MFSNGFTVIDVANPSEPKPVKFISNGPHTRSHHLQVADDLLLVANGADIPTLGKYNPNISYYQNSFADGIKGAGEFAAGLRIYDVANPATPREIAFLEMPGIGINRLWYVGGRWAWVSAHLDGFTDHLLVVVDMQDPQKPTMAGRWWLPGMWRAGGEVPTWTNRRVALHHMIVAGDRGYAAWRDGGMTVMDLSDPTKPAMLSHVNTAPPYPGGTHTPLPLPGRHLAAILDESNGLGCPNGLSYTWLYDVRDPANPVSISTLPTPTDQDWCRPGQNFGPTTCTRTAPAPSKARTCSSPPTITPACVSSTSGTPTPPRDRPLGRTPAHPHPRPPPRQRPGPPDLRRQRPARRHHVPVGLERRPARPALRPVTPTPQAPP